jgi:hypothetical protein
MTNITGSMGLVMFGNVAHVGEREIFPSGVNREFGYWRGSYNKTIVNKFNKLYMPLEGTGLYSGSPIVQSKKEEPVAEGGLACYDEGCAWLWDGAEWVIYENYCDTDPLSYDANCGCTEPPTDTPDSFSSFEVRTGACGSSVSSGSSTGDSAGDGFAIWQRAGDLVNLIGREAIQERCLYLSERANVNLGSGVSLAGSKGFSVYSKILPSGDISDTVILAQHKENPAKFVLGCDYDGRFYVRSDGSVSGDNTAFVAKSQKSYQEYKYPAHVVGVFASGDSRLKIYVNGKKEGESAAFSRDMTGADSTDIILGKRGFAISERGFTGWVDEVGIGTKSLSDEEVSKFYNHTFGVTDIIKSYSPPTGAAFDAGLFSSSFDAKDRDFIQFTVESGNLESVIGGSFDKNLWGNADYSVSSVLDVRLGATPLTFHQLNSVAVDVWVENSTNHPSGAKLSASLAHKNASLLSKKDKSLNWSPSGIMVPSGTKQKITFSAPLGGVSTFFPDGKGSFRNDFGDHELKLTVYYPSYDHPYDAEFKVYSTKVRYESYDRYTNFNNIDGELYYGAALSPGNGTDLPLFMDAGLAIKASGDLRLTMFVDKATQSMPLIINQDAKTSMSNGNSSYLTGSGAVVINDSMNLSILSAIEKMTKTLFIGGKVYYANNNLTLETKGGIDIYPYIQKTMPLMIVPEAGTGIASDSMNLTFPNVASAKFNVNFPHYIEGKRPIATMPLTLKTTESGVNTTKLYLLGPSVYNKSDSMNLYMQPDSPQFLVKGKRFAALPTIAQNNSMDMVTTGRTMSSGTMDLVLTSVKASGNWDTTLYTRGYRTTD